MRERIGILLAGKRVLFTIVIGLLCSLSLSADYKLVLTDVDGNQTQECVKSYSFSNNLESIAKQSGVAKDIYSKEETLTNKVWIDGKPIYRRVQILTGLSQATSFNGWRKVLYNFDTSVIEKLVSGEVDFDNAQEHYTHYEEGVSQFRYEIIKTGLRYVSSGTKYLTSNSTATVILEYTKTTDTANTSPNKFKSFLHYTLSSSETEEVITKNMKNLGVQILEGYSYDASTNSCTKN